MVATLDPKSPRPRTFDVSKSDVLSAWLSRALAASVEITSSSLLGGGAVQENWRIDVTVADGTRAGHHAWILRTDGAQRLSVSIDRGAEAAAIMAARAAGVPVAEPIARCDDGDVIGRPFLIQQFIAGTSAARQVAR
ncbi:MAG: phosphotransferase, partial [Hyphomicrobiaceae bacterium]